MKLFEEADLQEEKFRLMRYMEALSHADLIKKVLEFSMSVSLVASAFNSHPFGFKNLDALNGVKGFFLKRTNHSTMHFSSCKFF